MSLAVNLASKEKSLQKENVRRPEHIVGYGSTSIRFVSSVTLRLYENSK